MSDIVYSVEVQYLQKGSLGGAFGSGSGGLTQSIGKAQKEIAGSIAGFGEKLGSGLNSAFNKFFAAEAVVGGVNAAMGAIKVGLVGMNAEIEQMSISMATMFSAHGNVDGFNNGLTASKEIIKIMRKDARDLPGEFKDLTGIMMRMTTPALGAGLSIRETEKLAANAMAVGVGAGMAPDVVGREMGDLIQGRMRKNMPILKILPNFDVDSKAFNAMSVDKRVERLSQALGLRGGKEGEAISAMRAAFEKSWTGLFSSLKDNVKGFLGDLTGPLFERIKGAVGWVNDWFNTRGSYITEWATKVGYYLAEGFTFALHQLARFEPILVRIGSFLAKEADSGKLFGDIEKVVATAAALKAGSVVAPMAGSLAQGLPSMLGAGGEALGGIGGALGLEGGVAALAGLGVVLGVVAAAAVAVYGAFEGVANELSPMHETILSTWVDIKDATKEFAGLVYGNFEMIWPAVRRVSEILGGAFLQGILLFMEILGQVAAGIQIAIMMIVDAWGKIKELIRQALILIPGGALAELLEPDKKLSKLRDRPELERPVRSDLDKKVPPPPPQHTTHVHKVEINVNSNQDPNRIAKKTADIFGEWARNPKTATGTGAPIYSR
jgi:hypothetical protein